MHVVVFGMFAKVKVGVGPWPNRSEILFRPLYSPCNPRPVFMKRHISQMIPGWSGAGVGVSMVRGAGDFLT